MNYTMFNFIKACDFAAKKHRDQRRKDASSSPYINHPLNVAYILSECKVIDINILSAAVLHDVIEDTKTTKEELIKEFGETITNLVLECSDDKLKSKIRRKQLQIEHSSFLSDGAKLIKLADKYSNMSDLLQNPPKSWTKEEIWGCAVWSQEVCRRCYGINKLLDNKLQELFNKYEFNGIKISDINEQEVVAELSQYYSRIDKSD